jgi:hypothetical protein
MARIRTRGAAWVLAAAVTLAAATVAPAPARADAGDAIARIDELVAGIDGAGLPRGLAKSLSQKLLAVRASVERGRTRAALGQLDAFSREVLAQRGKKLGEDLADGALEAAHVVRVAIAPGPPPALENLVVEFGPWDPVTDRAGDFAFEAGEEKVFLEFGAVVSTPEGPKALPTFELRVAPDATVVSPISGRVARVALQDDTGDYELRLLAADDSAFLVIVDHVAELAVAEGQAVAAGQPLGKPGPWSATLGRVELQVFDFVARESWCPFELFDPALAPAFEAQVAALMADWEAFRADATLYDEASMVRPGCLAASLAETP